MACRTAAASAELVATVTGRSAPGSRARRAADVQVPGDGDQDLVVEFDHLAAERGPGGGWRAYRAPPFRRVPAWRQPGRSRAGGGPGRQAPRWLLPPRRRTG